MPGENLSSGCQSQDAGTDDYDVVDIIGLAGPGHGRCQRTAACRARGVGARSVSGVSNLKKDWGSILYSPAVTPSRDSPKVVHSVDRPQHSKIVSHRMSSPWAILGGLLPWRGATS
jgi:hypothetical protein